MKYQRFIIGEIQTNCYLVYSDKAAGIIDPGGPVNVIIDFLEKHQLKPEWIVNTHGHFDHIAGNAELVKHYGIPLYIHPADRSMLISAEDNLSRSLQQFVVSPDATGTIVEGDELVLGGERFRVLETPGHTPGGISLYTQGMVFSGDALFFESIGRTDLPGGDYPTLVSAIQAKLLTLPDDTLVFPGHGPSTTIRHERQNNPYLV
ncbi:MAG TPA: MBL fold metallo-hydrolase [Bacillota bacterium]|nr:MBL fold metallo-hydrolase [Bacillota bacterium]